MGKGWALVPDSLRKAELEDVDAVWILGDVGGQCNVPK